MDSQLTLEKQVFALKSSVEKHYVFMKPCVAEFLKY